MQFAPRLTNGTQPIALNGLSRVGRAVDLPMDAKPSVQLVRNGTATVRILRLVFCKKSLFCTVLAARESTRRVRVPFPNKAEM